MLNRPLLWITTVGFVAAGLSGCSSGAGQGAATPSSSASSPTSVASPTTPTMTPTRPRTAAQIKSALLVLADLPSGYAVEPSGAGGDDDGASSSSNPKCKQLVQLTNADVAPGSKATAKVSFSGGQSGPFVDESIDALDSADSVKTLQASLKSAVATCSQLTVTIPGQGTSTMAVAEVSPPKVGDHPFAVRMTATGGPLDGLEITQVTAGVKDTVVAITFVMATPEDVDGATQDAVGKAKEVLGGSRSDA